MIPEVNKEYYFFDDGKTSPSRCYKAKVLRVIPYNEEVLVNTYNEYAEDIIPTDLREVHKEEVENCNWIFAPETDYFIECSIPGYDNNNIWFARTKEKGWFSMNIQSFWQSGRLDIDNSIYQEVKEYFDNNHGCGWYDNILKQKGELIV